MISLRDMEVEEVRSQESEWPPAGAGLNGGVTSAVAGQRAERALVFGGTAHIENKRLDWESQIGIAAARASGAGTKTKFSLRPI